MISSKKIFAFSLASFAIIVATVYLSYVNAKLILAVVEGLAAATGVGGFLFFTIKQVFVNTLSQEKRLKLDKEASKWWEGAINASNSIVTEKVKYLSKKYSHKSPYERTNLVLFYSTFFTLIGLTLGNLFSLIRHFDLYTVYGNDSLGDKSDLAISVLNEMGRLNVYQRAGDLLLYMSVMSYIIWLLARKRKTQIVFAMIVVVVQTGLLFTPISMLGFAIPQWERPGGNFNFFLLIVLNIGLFIIFRKMIEEFSSWASSAKYLILVVLLNILIVPLLKYNSFILIRQIFVSGLISTCLVYLFVNGVSNYIVMMLITKMTEQISDSYSKNALLFLASFITSILLCLCSLLLYDLWHYLIHPIAKEPFFEWLYLSNFFELTTGTYTEFFVALSVILPFLMFSFFTLTWSLSLTFSKYFAWTYFYLYSFINDTRPGGAVLIPFYIIASFVTLIVGVGVTLYKYFGLPNA